MRRTSFPKAIGIAIALTVTHAMLPGCVIRFGSLTGDETTGDGTDTGTTPQDPATPEPTPPEQAEPDLTDIAPQEIALAQAKASLTTAYLVAQAESSGIDPSTLDAAALEQLMQQYLPAASASADAWLSTLDPAMIQAIKPNPTCEFDNGCASRIPCKYNPPPMKHLCIVTDCGKSKCSICPDWIADLLKSLIVTDWCAYVCIDMIPNKPNSVVAIGAGGVSAFNGNFIGPICKAP